MGLTHVTVSLSNLLADSPAYENEFLVDTKAIDCRAPGMDLRAAQQGNMVTESQCGI